MRTLFAIPRALTEVSQQVGRLRVAFEFAGFELSTGLPEDKTDGFAVRLDVVKSSRRKQNSNPYRDTL